MKWDERSRVLAGALWMVAITMGLFLLPGINGLLAGFVGVYKFRGAGRILVPSLVAGSVAVACQWLQLTALNLPMVGIFSGAPPVTAMAFSAVGLVVGGVVGGIVTRVAAK
jgi:hypothetical protein